MSFNVFNLIYTLKSLKINLWINEKQNLSFTFDKELGFPENLKDEIKKFKNEIIIILNYNNINSEIESIQNQFYKIPEKFIDKSLCLIQKGMFLQSQIEVNNDTYNIPLFIELKNIDDNILEKSIEILINKHPILRMVILENFTFKILDFNQNDINHSMINIENKHHELSQRTKINLTNYNQRLIQTEIIKILDTSTTILNLTHHHMLTDAYSSELIINDIINIISEQVNKKNLSESKIQYLNYFDFLEFQKYEIQKNKENQKISHILKKLNSSEKINLIKKTKIKSNNSASNYLFKINKNIKEKIENFALKDNSSVYSILLTTFYRVLSIFSGGNQDFPLGVTISNRPIEFKNSIGPFISVLPFIPELKNSLSLKENINIVHKEVLLLNDLSSFNLDLFSNNINKNDNIMEMIQVMFTMHNYKFKNNYAFEYSKIQLQDNSEKFYITVVLRDNDDNYDATVTYVSELFDDFYIKSIFDTFLNLLENIANFIEKPLDQFNLLSTKNEENIISLWNNTKKDNCAFNNIVKYFEHSSDIHASKTALIYKNKKISYKELNEKTNKIAHYLKYDLKVKNDDYIALFLERSELTIIAILAILKAGAAYVPIDTNYPKNRIEYILNDSNANIVISDNFSIDKLNYIKIDNFIILDNNDFENKIKLYNKENLNIEISKNNLAYIIYTSGTSGQPKGVMLEHQGIVNRIVWMNNKYPINENDRILHKTPYVFDVSVWELLWANWFGAAIVVAKPDGHKEPDYIIDLIQSEHISVLHFVPSMLNIFCDFLEQQKTLNNKLQSLKYIFCSGEELKIHQVQRVRTLLPHVKIHNLYGPTEASIDVLYFDCNSSNINDVLIGKPIDNTTAYILDNKLNIIPIGAIGELCVGGIGLARGYINRKDLTEEKFVQNPYQNNNEKRLNYNSKIYRTGDLARFLPDGNIQFIGRKDFQVKILGNRIELSEIENILERIPEIKQAAVIVNENFYKETNETKKHLVAYYVSDKTINEDKISQNILQYLPEYMIPNYYQKIDKMPLSINGKLDKKLLPKFEINYKNKKITPKNNVENQLTEIFSDILKIPKENISTNDDFFKLGGDSILSIQLVSKAKKFFGNNLTFKDIFTLKSIEKIANKILFTSKNENINFNENFIEQNTTSDPFSLLPIQKWFFNNKFEQYNYWNQSFLIKTPILDINKIKNSIISLLKNHDIFRIKFKTNKETNSIFQYYDENYDFSKFDLEIVDKKLYCKNLNNKLSTMQNNFNIEHGPLYKFAYIHGYEDNSARIFIAYHHLIGDSVSWRIISEDLYNAYQNIALYKTSSFKQWIYSLENYSKIFQDEFYFWNDLLQNKNTYFNDFKGFTDNINENEFSLNITETIDLLRNCHSAYNTKINDILLASLSCTFSNFLKNKNEIFLTLEGHGREELDNKVDLSKTIGWLTSMFPVKLKLFSTSKDAIISAKNSLRLIPNNGIGYGLTYDSNYKLLPKICFNYLGRFEKNNIKNDEWHFVNEDSGISVSPINHEYFDINIYCMVLEDKFICKIKSRLSNNNAIILCDLFKNSILQNIQHCINSENHEYTESDFWNVQSESDLTHLPVLPKSNKHEWFEMTEIQKSYLLGRLSNYEIGNISNHIYCEYYYEKLNIEKLEDCIDHIIKKHDVLRSIFSYKYIKQKFLNTNEIEKYHIKTNDFNEKNINETDLDLIRSRLSHKVYDPEKFPLFTFEISKFKDNYILHVSIDLILLDVQSRINLFNDISNLYNNKKIESKISNISFKDYQDYIQLLKYSKWYQKDKLYWLNKIPSMPLRPNFNFKISPEKIEKPKFSNSTIYIDKNIWSKFKQKAELHNISYSSILLSLFGKVISVFSGYQEFIITVTLFNRYSIHDDVNNILGDFTSTNIFHFKELNNKIHEFLENNHNLMWEDISHSLFSGLDVQREILKHHSLDIRKAVSPIIFTGVVGNKETQHNSSYFLDKSELLSNRFWTAQTSQAWIDLQAIEIGDKFMSKWLFVEQLFENQFIEKMNKIYCSLIQFVAESNWNNSFSNFNFLTSQDHKLITESNSSYQEFNNESLVIAIERQMKKKQIATKTVVTEENKNKKYSYQKLLNDADILARYLLNHNPKSNQLIAVFAEKGYAQVLTTYAIMKSGYAFLPLSIDWPLGRIEEVIAQGNVHLVLTTKECSHLLIQQNNSDSLSYKVIEIDSVLEQLNEKKINNLILNTPLPTTNADDIAYVIFTSGTTGKPKGVTISHGSVLNTILAVNQKYQVTHNDSILALSDLSFDLAIYDIYGMLLTGGHIIYPQHINNKNPSAWVALVTQHSVTLWNSVPQLANLFIEELNHSNTKLTSLRLFLLSGDWIPTNLPNQIKQYFPHGNIVSLGGATEGSIWSIWYEINSLNPQWTSIPYGSAMPNQKMYVLRDNNEHCPVGVPGEIHIGGVGVALNYWGDETLTNNKFFNHKSLGRLYKTGDLGKWHENGFIQFLGRKDFQVKLNGYRVELEEIERVLLKFLNIKQVFVVIKEETQLNKKILVAYFTAESLIDEKILITYIKNYLPDYMIPNYFIQIESIPLNINGKVDKSKLPSPKINLITTSALPENTIEEQLLDIWSTILTIGKEKIGVNDDIFKLGADSIICIQLVMKIRNLLKTNIIGLKEIFELKTIRSIAKNIINKSEQNNDENIKLREEGILEGSFSLFPVQQWFFNNKFKNENHWNLSVLIKVPELNLDHLKNCFNDLINFHDSLRIIFKRDNSSSTITQHYCKNNFSNEIKKLNIKTLYDKQDNNNFDKKLNNILSGWQNNFNIENGPLLSIGYIYGYSDNSCRLFLAFHHLIIDTVSIRIIVEDLKNLYNKKPLENKYTSYRQWVNWINNYHITYNDEKLFWNELTQNLSNYEINNFKLNNEISKSYVILTNSDTDKILKDCNSCFNTKIIDLLLSSLSYTLTQLTNFDENYIILEGHGRENIDNNYEIGRTAGWFTALFPFKLITKNNYYNTIITNKDNLRKIPHNGIGYGSIFGYNNKKMPSIIFNYLGQFDNNTELDNFWAITNESSGITSDISNTNPFPLTIYGYIVNGKLQLNIESYLDKNITNQFSLNYNENLKKIINFTSEYKHKCITESDVNFIVKQSTIEKIRKQSKIHSLYLANSLQQVFVSHSLNHGTVDNAYRVQSLWEYVGNLDVAVLKKSWEIAQKKYFSLNLRFFCEEEIIQVIDKKSDINWSYFDITNDSYNQKEDFINKIKEKDSLTPYKMNEGKLFRIYLIKKEQEKFLCIFNIHHAISDGWSSSILLQFIHENYIKIIKNIDINYEQDTAYIQTQKYLQEHQYDHLDYWNNYISHNSENFDYTSLLKNSYHNLNVSNYNVVKNKREEKLIIDQNIYNEIINISKKESITINSIIHFVLAKTLTVFLNTRTSIVGTIFSGRNLPITDIEKSVGLFINTLPLIVNFNNLKNHTIIEAIKKIQENIQEINSKTNINLSLIQKGNSRLFSCLFTFENYPNKSNIEFEKLIKINHIENNEKRDYPISFDSKENLNELELVIIYDEEIFDPNKILNFLNSFKIILKQVAFNSYLKIEKITLFEDHESNNDHKISILNNTEKHDSNLSIIYCFEKIVSQFPNNIAVVNNNKKISYCDLNIRSNQLANYIVNNYKLSTLKYVGICFEKNENTIICILSILKLKLAYIPIDPSFPEEKLKNIISSSNLNLIIVNSNSENKFNKLLKNIDFITIDNNFVIKNISECNQSNLTLNYNELDLAYVLFTSGTTGSPKGVMVQNRSFVKLIYAFKDKYYKNTDCISTYSLTNPVFDIFGLEYGLTILTGGTIEIGSVGFDSLNCKNYHFIQTTPSIYEIKIGKFYNTENCSLVIGGEKLYKKLLEKSLKEFSKIIHVYGPTETTIWSSSQLYEKNTYNETHPITIGTPFNEEILLILDSHLNTLPNNVIGELYIGGVGVAEGYLKNKNLTSEKFIKNPFKNEFNNMYSVIYKTGDLARKLNNGNIEFIRRNDTQVKIRGNRIELSEIESCLLSFNGITQALAIIKEIKLSENDIIPQKYILCYYVSNPKILEEKLFEFLKEKIPEYMIPNKIYYLENFPLNLNGKIDINNLPTYEIKKSSEKLHNLNYYEKIISDSWKKILRQDEISIYDNFFDVGGNSILLLKMFGNLPDEIKKYLQINDFFKYTTIHKISKYLQDHMQKTSDNKQNNTSNNNYLNTNDIAIIGIAGRFPGADNIEEFWENLKLGQESIQVYSYEELLNEGVSKKLLDNPNYVFAQSALKDIKTFDANFFGYTPREAELMDPQHKIFLECVWHALEDAHYNPFTYTKKIGLYASAGHNNYYSNHILPNNQDIDLATEYQVMIHNQANFLCTKVAYKLNLTGPAVTIQTACSSSLVAVHQACCSLIVGDSDIAIAGGISIGQLGKSGYLFQESLIFSPDGKCRAFDENACGTFEGQGCGVVVLKSLEKALKDNDNIYAVIKGSAINNDGNHKIGFTAPSPEKQSEVIKHAIQKAGIEPQSISYIEAHGTGTKLGDPLEFEGLCMALANDNYLPQSCAIGSLKTNIGHLDVASGIAGLIKAALCLKNKTLVPSLHYKNSNPKINFEKSPFFVNTKTCAWTNSQYPLRAGVSSFGIGGTNAHVILEDSKNNIFNHHKKEKEYYLINISAQSLESINKMENNLLKFLKNNEEVSIQDLAFTLHTTKNVFKFNKFIASNNIKNIISYLESENIPIIEKRNSNSIIFMFPGQGSQYINMGRDLYYSEPYFKQQVDQCVSIVHDLNYNISILDLLGQTNNIHQIDIIHPSLFIIEYSLAIYLIHLGIKPNALIGHSFGEYVAACVSGVFSLKEALNIVIQRGVILKSLKNGKMIHINCSHKIIETYLIEYNIDIAAINYEDSCVISGSVQEIDKFSLYLNSKNITFKEISVQYPFHSRKLDKILEKFENIFNNISFNNPKIPIYSNLTGNKIDDESIRTKKYWVNHLRNTVLFSKAINSIFNDYQLKNPIFIEVGPSNYLKNFVLKNTKSQQSVIIPCMKTKNSKENDLYYFLNLLGFLNSLGIKINWNLYYSNENYNKIKTPLYPFDRKLHWTTSIYENQNLKKSNKTKIKENNTIKESSNILPDDDLIKLRQIWEKTLGIKNFNNNSDFFDLGGDSLSAIQLIALIKNNFGVSLEIMCLEKITIDKILLEIKKLQEKNKNKEYRTIVNIKSGSSKKLPLILVHPIGGDIYFYRELAENLAYDQSIFAIRSPMLHGGIELDSIENMASYYLHELAKSKITPPYILGGSSFGGIVAYEMAQQVYSTEKYLPTIVMIDSPSFGNLPKLMTDNEILEYLIKYGLAHLNISISELNKFDTLSKKINFISEISKNSPLNEILSADFLYKFIYTWKIQNNAMHNYRPYKYDGNLIFFSHKEIIKEFPSNQFVFWEKLFTGNKSNFEAPGNHITMNFKPNVKIICEILDREIFLMQNSEYNNL